MLTTKIDPQSKQPLKKAKMNPPPPLRRHVDCYCKVPGKWCNGRCTHCNDLKCLSGKDCIHPWKNEWNPDTYDKQAAEAWQRHLSIDAEEAAKILEGIPNPVVSTLTKTK